MLLIFERTTSSVVEERAVFVAAGGFSRGLPPLFKSSLTKSKRGGSLPENPNSKSSRWYDFGCAVWSWALRVCVADSESGTF